MCVVNQCKTEIIRFNIYTRDQTWNSILLQSISKSVLVQKKFKLCLHQASAERPHIRKFRVETTLTRFSILIHSFDSIPFPVLLVFNKNDILGHNFSNFLERIFSTMKPKFSENLFSTKKVRLNMKIFFLAFVALIDAVSAEE